MTRVRVLPQADTDIDEAADVYARVEGIELGLRFYDAVERTWGELEEHPKWESPSGWIQYAFQVSDVGKSQIRSVSIRSTTG